MHIHKYSPWKDIKSDEVFAVSPFHNLKDISESGSTPVGRLEVVQERRCSICGKLQMRTVSS